MSDTLYDMLFQNIFEWNVFWLFVGSDSADNQDMSSFYYNLKSFN